MRRARLVRVRVLRAEVSRLRAGSKDQCAVVLGRSSKSKRAMALQRGNPRGSGVFIKSRDEASKTESGARAKVHWLVGGW
jgi:hypothetical protein